MTTHEKISQALRQLAPGAMWTLHGDDLSGLTWLDTKIPQPASGAIDVSIAAGPPVTILPQDLIAQLTAADISAIQSSVASNSANALLWYALIAQHDPMEVVKPRFQQGWAALVGILGRPRTNAIAAALGVASLAVNR